MDNTKTLTPAPMIFSLAAGLAAYMAGGLTAGAAAFLLCTLAAGASDRFGRICGFIPAFAGVLAAVLLHGRFMAECAGCADDIAYLSAVKAHAAYIPVAGAEDSTFPLIVTLLLCGMLCAVYSAAGEKAAMILLSTGAAAYGYFTGRGTAVLCVIIALTAGAVCFGAREIRSLPLIGLTVLLTMPALLINMPEIPKNSTVTASGGLPLYLAQSYEQPVLTKAQYARGTAIFTALQQHGFDPRFQTAYLLEAANSDIPTETVTAELAPANVCAGDIDENTLDGYTGSSFTVCRLLDRNIFTLLPKLREGDYLDCESLYREYVYSAYGSLTESQAQRAQSLCAIDGSLPLDRKLSAVKAGVNAHISDESERTRLTVELARSCGIAAREVRGVYFSSMPQSGSAELSDGERRSWAEVYIDGAGWVTFETKPEYESASPLLPEDTAGGESGVSTAFEDSFIYTYAQPRTAAEIRSEQTDVKPSPMWVFFPAGGIALLIIAGRVRAVVRSSARHSRSNEKALRTAHKQGRLLVETMLNIKDLPPEKLSSQLEGALLESFNSSQRAYDRARFSKHGADEVSAEAARKFFDEAVRASKAQGVFKSLCRRVRGLY